MQGPSAARFPDLPPRPPARRRLLLACACLLAAGMQPAIAETIEIKVSHYVPPSSTIHHELVRWAAEIAEKSKGRLTLSLFPSGQMGPVTRQFDLARTGVADAAFFMHGAVPGRFPMTELAQLPYAFNPNADGKTQAPLSSAEASAILTSLAPQLTKEYAGTRVLYLIAQPNISLFFNKAAVHKPGDMKGMRIRHNGPMPAKMIEAWGATPAAVAPVELADALGKGTVDGMTFNYEAAESFQFGAAVRTVTEINAYAVTFAFVMNEKKYESLPADLRKLIDETTGVEAARRIGGRYDQAEVAGRKYLLDHKVEITVPTDDALRAFQDPLKPLVEQTIADARGKGLAASQFFGDLRARVNEAKR